MDKQEKRMIRVENLLRDNYDEDIPLDQRIEDLVTIADILEKRKDDLIAELRKMHSLLHDRLDELIKESMEEEDK